MTPRTLVLYGHGYCSLCEVMWHSLQPYQGALGFVLERVDIHERPELEARFGERVPVLVEGDEEICHYRLDEQALRQRFITE